MWVRKYCHTVLNLKVQALCKMRIALFILFLIVALIDARQPLPKYIQTCRRRDPQCNKCFAEKANLVLPLLAKGDPDYNIPTLMPQTFLNFVLTIETPTLKFYLKDIKAHEIEKFKITDAIIDFHNKTIQYTLLNDKIMWNAKFILIINILGVLQRFEGEAVVHFRNGAYLSRLGYELRVINGVEYANVNKYDVEFLRYLLDFKLGDLDSKPAVQDALASLKKNFVNDKFRLACGYSASVCFNGIFNNVPFNEVFPP